MDNQLKVNGTTLETLVAQHINLISPSRIGPYITLCKNMLPSNVSDAERCAISICVYTALQHRSSIFFSLIQEIEISARNEISIVLKAYAQEKQDITLEEYFCFLAFDSQSPLPDASVKQLKSAITDVVGRHNSNGKNRVLSTLATTNKDCNNIIASLTFGFWVHLFNPKNKNHIHWSNILHKDKIFQGQFNSSKDIYHALYEVLIFRNKLFHQDVIWKGKGISSAEKALNNLERKYKTFSDLLLKIAPDRHAVRLEAAWQKAQNGLNFDLEIFHEEILHLYERYFGQNLNVNEVD